MAMPAGKRRHKVRVVNPGTASTTSDASYAQTYSTTTPLADPVKLMVSIEPATQARLERLASGTAIANATHIVTAPYHADVTTQTRLLFGSRTFYVVGVANPGERNRETVMICTELVT